MRRILVFALAMAALVTSPPDTGVGRSSYTQSNPSERHHWRAPARRPDDGVSTVTIEDGTTVNMSCDTGQSPVLCRPTGSGAVLSTSDLETYLAASSVIVTTNGSASSQVADIDVVSPVAWSAATTLTLDANHSINVTSSIVVEGEGASAGLSLIVNAGLALLIHDGKNLGYLTFGAGGSVQFAHTNNSLSINGASYTLAGSIEDLANAIVADPSGNFALANNVDASGKTYATAPIAPIFYGNFEGLGNTIAHLKISDNSELNVGLFQEIDSGIVENLNLADVLVTSTNVSGPYMGALVGFVQSEDQVPTPIFYNDTVSGTVASFYEVDYGPGAVAGGLVGENIGGTIIAAVSSANVKAPAGTAGGVAGFDAGSVLTDLGEIAYSSASGAVAGQTAGGLVGWSDEGEIFHSTASGDVTFGEEQKAANLGGLVGYISTSGSVEFSSASGNVTSNQKGGTAGGLVGATKCCSGSVDAVHHSYATGNVSGYAPYSVYIGGLVGLQGGAYDNIEDSYEMGSVTCAKCTGRKGEGLGGLVGVAYGTTATSYATGLVTFGGSPGKHCSKGCVAGVTGRPKAAQYSFVYWDTETTQQPYCTGKGDVPGCKGKTTAEFTAGLPRGFKKKIWTRDPNGMINGGYPYLIDNPPPQ